MKIWVVSAQRIGDLKRFERTVLANTADDAVLKARRDLDHQAPCEFHVMGAKAI